MEVFWVLFVFTIKTRLFKRNICGWDRWEKRQDILGTERRQEPRDGGGRFMRQIQEHVFFLPVMQAESTGQTCEE